MIVITLSKRLSILPTVMHEFSQPSEATSPPPSWPTHHHRPAHAGTRRARRHGRHEGRRKHLSPPSRGKTTPPSRQLSCRDPSEYPRGCLGHIPSLCVAENGCRRRVRTERGRRAAVVVPPSRCWPEEEEKGHAQTGHGVSPNRVDAQPAPQSASIAAEGCLATTRAVPGRTVAGGTRFPCRCTADQRLQV